MKRTLLLGGVFAAALAGANLIGTGISRVYGADAAPEGLTASPRMMVGVDPEAALYHYRVTVNDLRDVYDGDTIKRASLDLGCNITLHGQDIRLLGIDTPEMRGGTPESKAAAVRARDFLRNLIDQDGDGEPDAELIVRTEKGDAFGRWLGWLYVRENGRWIGVSDLMISEGHAQPYNPKG